MLITNLNCKALLFKRHKKTDKKVILLKKKNERNSNRM